MDSQDRKWFSILGLLALIAWPIYWIYRMVTGNDEEY